MSKNSKVKIAYIKPSGEPSGFSVIKEAKLKIGRYEKELKVIAYEVNSSLSCLTEINILILCRKNIKISDLLGKTASFKLQYEHMKLSYSCYVGAIESHMPCSQLKDVSTDNVVKEIRLYDKLFKLKNNVKSRVFKPGGPKDILNELFKGYSLNYDLKILINDRRIVCQYNEDDYTFLCRVADYYNLGYYYDHSAHKYVVHDNPNYNQKFKIKDDLKYIMQEYACNSKVIYSSRNEWNTSVFSKEYSSKTINATRSFFLEGNFSNPEIVKQISQYKSMSEIKTMFIYHNIYLPLYPGAMLNNKVIKSFNIVQEYEGALATEIHCIDSGICKPEFEDIRGYVVSAGFTQANASKVVHNQHTIKDETFEIPVKMFFEKKNLLFARQTYLWLGKFYGTNFPIREQAEVLILFADSLMSACYVVSCYANKSNSQIMAKNEVGIKTASLKTTSKEKNMNTLIFDDTKDNEIVKFTGKKNMLIQAYKDIKIHSDDTITTSAKNMSTKTEENFNLETTKDINFKGKVFNIDVEKQEIKSTEEHKIEAPKSLILSSKKIDIGDAEINIKAKSLTIDADKLVIKSKTGELTIAGNFKMDIKMLDMKIKVLQAEIAMLKVKSNMSMLQIEMCKLDAKMILFESKILAIMSKLVNIASSMVMIGPG